MRLIVIGGAASLEVKPGLVFTDSDELVGQALDQFGLPREYAAAMRGHGDALNMFRTSNRLWIAALDKLAALNPKAAVEPLPGLATRPARPRWMTPSPPTGEDCARRQNWVPLRRHPARVLQRG